MNGKNNRANNFEQHAKEMEEIAKRNSVIRFAADESHIERMRASSNSFQIWRDYLEIMSIEEAAVLCNLVNVAFAVKASLRGGWFRYTVKQMDKDLKLKER